MREDLLGYLLSALQPHEMRRVDQRLQDDPQLREELAQVQQMLRTLDRAVGAEEVVEVPPHLVSRTLANIPPRPPAACHLRAPEVAFAPGRDAAVTLRPALEPPPRGRRSWSDLVVMSTAAVAMVALLLPLAARLRSEARSVACQDNLRQLGVALGQFAMRESESHLPALAPQGPEAFSGMYAVRLADRGLLSDASLRWCPATDLPLAGAPPTGDGPSKHASALTHLVVGEDLERAAAAGDVSQLRWLQQVAGGHYAYSLGVINGSRYDAPQYEGRTSFAVLGDAPISGHQVTDGVDVSKLRWSHGGDGANLLYEDGSVRHLRIPAMLGLTDHPFVNHRGSIEAGVNIDDASLAPSWRPPFIEARQR